MTYNAAAYRQRHRGDYDGPGILHPDAKYRCPCCPLLLTRDWFRDIFGCEPEDYPYPRESPLRWAR